MSRKVLLALLLAGVLLAAPLVVRAEDDAEEYDDEDGDEGGAGGAAGEPSEKDVVVIGDKNWTDVIGKSKYALVSWFLGIFFLRGGEPSSV